MNIFILNSGNLIGKRISKKTKPKYDPKYYICIKLGFNYRVNPINILDSNEIKKDTIVNVSLFSKIKKINRKVDV